MLKTTRHLTELRGDRHLTLNSYPGAFSQIVTNLVMNSLLHAYASNQQGHITLVFEQIEEQVIFEYADDDQGIPSENLGKFFEPFFTTKRSQGGS